MAGGCGRAGLGPRPRRSWVCAAAAGVRGRVRGRVAGFSGAGPIGQLNIGIMAGIYDPRTAVMITAIMGLAVMLVATVAFPILRRADSMRIDSRLRAMNSADLRRMAESPGGD